MRLIESDDQDKQNIDLVGMKLKEIQKTKMKTDLSSDDGLQPVIRVQSNCISHAGTALPEVLNALKIACLNYYPSRVVYRIKEYERSDLISLADQVAERVADRKKKSYLFKAAEDLNLSAIPLDTTQMGEKSTKVSF